MGNSTDESDLDMMIITKKGSLWIYRLFAYFLIRLFNIHTRSPEDKAQKQKLCLNIWLDLRAICPGSKKIEMSIFGP